MYIEDKGHYTVTWYTLEEKVPTDNKSKTVIFKQDIKDTPLKEYLAKEFKQMIMWDPPFEDMGIAYWAEVTVKE